MAPTVAKNIWHASALGWMKNEYFRVHDALTFLVGSSCPPLRELRLSYCLRIRTLVQVCLGGEACEGKLRCYHHELAYPVSTAPHRSYLPLTYSLREGVQCMFIRCHIDK